MNKTVNLAGIRSALKDKQLVGFKRIGTSPSAADSAGGRKAGRSKVGQPKTGQSKIGQGKSGVRKPSQ